MLLQNINLCSLEISFSNSFVVWIENTVSIWKKVYLLKLKFIQMRSKEKKWHRDIHEIHDIKNVFICFIESRQRGRFAGFSIYVSVNDVSTTSEIKNSTLCYKDETHLPPLNFTAICASRGRYVIFYNERIAGVSYPAEYQVMDVLTELCEVVVQGTEILYIAHFSWRLK